MSVISEDELPFDQWNEEDDVPDDERDCYHCGGEGWDECDDPLECTAPHTKSGLCPCKSCGGSGDAKDMTIW